MKRISILLFFIALMMPPCHEPGTSMAQDATECLDTFPQQCGESVQLARLTLPLVGVIVPVAEGQAAAYFGHCSSDGTVGTIGSGWDGGSNWIFPSYTVPGTGARNVSKLGAWVYSNDGTSRIRMGLYNSTGSTLICQTDNLTVTPVGVANAAWIEGTGLTCAVTGSDTVFIVYGTEANSVLGTETTVGNTGKYFGSNGNYVGDNSFTSVDLSSVVTAGVNYTRTPGVRAYVDAN